jgi:hypothetical protein
MSDITYTGKSTPSNKADIEVRVAGGTIVKHDWVYADTTASNKVKQCDNDATATAKALGMALHAAVSGEYVLVAKNGARVTVGGGMTAKTFYYLSGNVGKTAPLADLLSGDYITPVCFAESTTVLVVDIHDTQITVS